MFLIVFSKSSSTIETIAKAAEKGSKQVLPKDPEQKDIGYTSNDTVFWPLHLYQKLSRVSRSLSLTVKKAILDFYEPDDISYQMPGKRDTVVIKEQVNGKKTYQKRILLYNLREAHQMFLQNSPGM